jgi:hypothetical protein
MPERVDVSVKAPPANCEKTQSAAKAVASGAGGPEGPMSRDIGAQHSIDDDDARSWGAVKIPAI